MVRSIPRIDRPPGETETIETIGACLDRTINFMASPEGITIDGEFVRPAVQQAIEDYQRKKRKEKGWGMMADDPTKVVALHGVGLLSGTLPDGRACLHYGGVFRFKGPAENPEVAKAFVEGAMAGVEALRNRGDCEPAGPLEMMGCWDSETHEVIHMWRMACVEIVTH